MIIPFNFNNIFYINIIKMLTFVSKLFIISSLLIQAYLLYKEPYTIKSFNNIMDRYEFNQEESNYARISTIFFLASSILIFFSNKYILVINSCRFSILPLLGSFMMFELDQRDIATGQIGGILLLLFT